MLTYSFTNLKNESLYMHLYQCIRQDIVDGKLVSGEKLPSKRSFAKNLGVSTITIENAYAQLLSEGYIYSIPKKGFYVSDFKNNVIKPVKLTTENVKLSSGQSDFLADFSSNQTRPENFPFSIWAKLMRETFNTNSPELMTKPPCGGIMGLRQAIATHLEQFRGMHVQPEQIFIGAGTEYLYGLLIQLLGFDKKYAIENPGYEKIAAIYNSYNVAYHYIPMDNNGILVDELEKSEADVVHISPSHHFPTGIVTPISRRYELLGWAAASTDRYIIEDDYDSELRLSGQPIPTLQSMDVSDKVIYMNTFTKTLASTVRISYMILPRELFQQYYKKLSFYSCTVSNFEQYTLAKFIEEGYFEKHINRLRNYYHNKRNTIVETIKKSRLNQYVSISGEEAGVHFLMKIETKKPQEQLMENAKAQGIKLSPLSAYYKENREEIQNTYVMNYSSIELEKIEMVVTRLAKCCE